MSGGGIQSARGMTLVELLIVMAVMAILLTSAAPAYERYLWRVHRSEAIGLLLQVSLCQERVRASRGSYDASQCRPGPMQHHYQIAYSRAEADRYRVMATPQGAQADDPCGSLWLDESGARGVSAADISGVKCWSGR